MLVPALTGRGYNPWRQLGDGIGLSGRGEKRGQPALSTAAQSICLLFTISGALGQSWQSPLFAGFIESRRQSRKRPAWGLVVGAKSGDSPLCPRGAVDMSAVHHSGALGQSWQSPLFAGFIESRLHSRKRPAWGLVVGAKSGDSPLCPRRRSRYVCCSPFGRLGTELAVPTFRGFTGCSSARGFSDP